MNSMATADVGTRARIVVPSWLLLVVLTFIYLSALMTTFLPSAVAMPLRWPALIAALGLLALRFRQAKSVTWERFIYATVLLFLAAAVASMMHTDYLALVGMKVFAQAATIALAVVAAKRLTPREWQKFLAGIQWMFGIASVAALLIGRQVAASRLGGLSNPNSLGAVGTVAASLWLWDLVERRNWTDVAWWGRLLIFLAALGVIGATGSRSSQAGFVAALVIAGMFVRNRRRLLGIVTILVLPSVLLLAFWQADSVTLLRSRWRNDTLLESREKPWSDSIAAWKKNPWIGYGFGVCDMQENWQGTLSSVGIVRDGTGYFGLLESVGVLGVLPFGILLILAGVRVCQVGLRRGVPAESWLPAMKAGTLFIALSVHHVGEPWLIGPGMVLNLLFWLSLGALIGCSRPLFVRRQDRWRRSRLEFSGGRR